MASIRHTVALAACFGAFNTAYAQDQYTVWSSVIFSRTGERTPEVLGNIPTTLTSLGAQEMYASGSYFRDRYLQATTSADGINGALLNGLNTNHIDPLQLYIMALDEQFVVASAQAFMQGLYPPYTLNESVAIIMDPTSMLANGSYVENPLGGYQYPHIHVVGAEDLEYPYLGGTDNCPALEVSTQNVQVQPEYAATEASSKDVYTAIGPPLLADVLPEAAWEFYNAYAIYDYLNYQNKHNVTVAALLSEPQYIDPAGNISYFDQVRWLADQQQYAYLGNLTAPNTFVSSLYDQGISLEAGVQGSISTIAGNLLAAKMLAQLQVAIETGGEYYKLSLLFGDFEPLMSFFALADLPALDSNFRGIPDFGSVIVFELFSYINASASTDLDFPDEEDLWVRFYFRNGTGTEVDSDANDIGAGLQSYPLFGNGPSQTDLPFRDFQAAMYEFLVGDIGVWCKACAAQSTFCAAFNGTQTSYHSGSWRHRHHDDEDGDQMKPAVAGVIGAVVSLAVAGLVFAAVMLCAGIRLHRVERSRKSELGGFKGSQKLASDQDLTIPKGGAVVGATVERSGSDSPDGAAGHERVGSWELKQAEAGRMSTHEDDHDDKIDPFRDPVKPDERV